MDIFQSRYTSGQQVHEKTFNIVSHQRDANQSCTNITAMPSGMSVICLVENDKCWADAEKLKPLYSVSGNYKWCSSCGKKYDGSSKS